MLVGRPDGQGTPKALGTLLAGHLETTHLPREPALGDPPGIHPLQGKSGQNSRPECQAQRKGALQTACDSEGLLWG